MSKEKYTALILGANGLIGSALLQYLLNEESYTCIYSITRSPLDVVNDKLIQIIADINSIENKLSNIRVDHFYSCIGTTKNKTPDKLEYYKIDHDYPILVAKELKNQGCNKISIVSSIGANDNSKNFYLQLKGKVENDIIALNYKSTLIYRPSLLIGNRNEKRITERIAQRINPIVDKILIGRFKNYRSIKATIVASAMVKLALIDNIGTNIYQTEEIKKNA